MFEVGRMCMKIAGRDAGKQCVVVDVIDHYHVLVDGETRRRKINVKHLEPLQKKIDIEKGASHEDVKSAFEGLGMTLVDTKPRKKAARPKKMRKKKVKKVKAAPVKTKATKKRAETKVEKESLEATVEPQK